VALAFSEGDRKKHDMLGKKKKKKKKKKKRKGPSPPRIAT